jgi:hypothetical protein
MESLLEAIAANVIFALVGISPLRINFLETSNWSKPI